MQIDRRSLLGAGVAAAATNILSTRTAGAGSDRSIALASPVVTGAATVDAQGCVAYPDTIVRAGPAFVFAGTSSGEFKNIMISVPGVSPWGTCVQDGKGGWTCTMDLSSVRSGPLNCRVMAWYDDWIEKSVDLDFTLLIDNPGVTRADPPVPAPAAGMTPILIDDFDAMPDDSRWAFGERPDGSQWGSDAHFTTKDGDLAEVFQTPMPSVLRIRAVYDPNFKDPQGWGRKWRSGMLCTAHADGRPPVAAFRRGYVEMRAILPLGKGMWPSMWAFQLGPNERGMKSNPGTEIDPLEGYCQTPDPGKYALSSGAIEWTSAGKTGEVDGPRFKKNFDATSDWHVYGAAVDETSMVVYVDGVVTQTIRLPKSTSADKFFWMFDNTLGGGWPVTVPPARYTDMWIDYIRIYSAD
ncbi:glycoside hydrolase family 16 protein [Aureimonas sp. Leaf454]|uniref:glycoside hydrolase family 16 protein n=1 Tax=Aureimonas sp. Leaf454 TaxID=1736381 RepID=UPI00138F0701|nr:glycoside hydrolase family 16 protein [Aureimonas sp. Leaf454]